MDNILLRKSFRIVIATLSTIFTIILIWVILDCFPRDVIVEEELVSYELEAHLNYIAGNKDNAVLNYDYLLKTDDNIESIYDYSVKAILKSKKDKKEILLAESIKEEKINTNLIRIKTEVIVPKTELYNEALALSKKDVTLDLELVTRNYVAVDVDDPEYLEITTTNSVSMPIDKMNTNLNDKKHDKNAIASGHKERLGFNSYLFSLSMICFVSIIPITILSYASLFNLSNYDEYRRKLKAIKKEYGSIIVSRKRAPSFKKKEIIEVNEFDNLMEHYDEEDIILFEKESGKESWFYLEKKKEVYLYILRLEHRPINFDDNTVIKVSKKHKK